MKDVSFKSVVLQLKQALPIIGIDRARVLVLEAAGNPPVLLKVRHFDAEQRIKLSMPIRLTPNQTRD